MEIETSKLNPIELEIIKKDIQQMSFHLLGMPFSDLKDLIYPTQPYKSFVLKKRSGGYRVISEPNQVLKKIQHRILSYLYDNAGKFIDCVHGFVKYKSIVSNAKSHCFPRTNYVLNVDLENFFPSITFYRVRGVFMAEPFCFSYQNATLLAHICTFNGSLPQGAPTSPMLANLVCRSMDRQLIALARRNRATYTRYCDDITFSFSVKTIDGLPSGICGFSGGLLKIGNELDSIVANNSFSLNSSKSRLSGARNRLEVTGLTINKFPNVRRNFIDSVRGALHAWEKYGYEKADDSWQQRKYHRQQRVGKSPKLVNVVWGKLLYIKMVRGYCDEIYTRLAERYNVLCEKEKCIDPMFFYPKLPVSAVVRNSTDAGRGVFVIEWFVMFDDGDCAGGQGTAFLYKDVGLITCDHVLSGISEKGVPVDCETIDGAVIKISNPIIDPIKYWEGKVVFRDKSRDLALIDFSTHEVPAARFYSGLASSIDKNKKGFLVGFPNHSPGKHPNQAPSLVLNKYTRGGLARIEVNELIRKGNSGGPYLDEFYRVVGVAQQGATQADGNNECLCVTELDKWIDSIKVL